MATFEKMAVAAAVAAVLAAGPASAQGTGYGVGEWDLVTQGGASVCRLVLSTRYIPQQANYRVFHRGGQRCTDWRVRNIVMWVVRGNTLKLSDGYGTEIAGLNEQNPDLYAAGEFALYRVGSHRRYRY